MTRKFAYYINCITELVIEYIVMMSICNSVYQMTFAILEYK